MVYQQLVKTDQEDLLNAEQGKGKVVPLLN
jgi:hypothetical protein